MTRKYSATIVGVLCLLLGLGAARSLADITSWSTSAAGNTSTIGTEGSSEGALPSTVNDSLREGYAQLAKFVRQGVLSNFAKDNGTANAYAISPALAPASYISGQVFQFRAANANTGTSTLKVGTLAATTIQYITNGVLGNLPSGYITATGLYTAVYDGTVFQMQTPTQQGALAALNTITTSSYIAAGAITFSNVAAATAGNIVTFNTSGIATVVTPGIAAQVLTSNGPNATPQFKGVPTTSIVRGTGTKINPYSTTGTSGQVAHGLGDNPNMVDAALVNITADCGYSPTERINLQTFFQQAANNGGGHIVTTTTSMQIRLGGAGPIAVFDKAAATQCVITAGSWAVLATPYLLTP